MPSRNNYDDDLFADSRMSFGEHIEELRTHLIRAIKGLVFCLVIGFILDAIGYAVGRDWIGIGKPMMGVITDPVREQLRAFYDRRMKRLEDDATEGDATAKKITAPRPVQFGATPRTLAQLRGKPAPDEDGPVEWFELQVAPVDLVKATRDVNYTIRPPELSALSVTETMVVYF